MRSRVLFVLIAFFIFGPRTLHAQIPCLGIHSGSFGLDDHVSCTIPQLYGPQGLIFLPGNFGGFVPPMLTMNPAAQGSFQQPSQTNFLLSVNQTIANQIASFPLVTPASGISLIYDQKVGVFVASTDSFGPIFSERASTIGIHRIGLGFSYQYMNFDSLDGVSLHRFPTLLVHVGNDPVSNQPCNAITNAGSCSRDAHDFVTASNRIDLHLRQYTAFATFGLTRRVDVSVAVPVLNMTMEAAADSNIVPNSSAPGLLSFNSSAPNATCLQTSSSSINSMYCSRALFSNLQRASGVGDVTVRIKGIVKSWERAGIVAGFEVRVPTGSERDFLGTGAYGIRSFWVWSYRGRISPHANLGYQWNGKSLLAGPIVAGNPNDKTQHNLPSQAFYSLGLEGAVTRRLTATVDLVGQTVINGARVRIAQELAPGLCDSSSCANPSPPLQEATIESYKATYAVNNAALGLRYLPFGKLLVSANVLLKLDNGGLRAKAIPMLSATYSFR